MSSDHEIDLVELFKVIWLGRLLISVVASVVLSVAVLFSLTLPNLYTAHALLAPAESGGANARSLIQQYGGLAGLAGINLPGNENSARAQLGRALMASRGFLADFVVRHNISPDLIAVESWDPITGELTYDETIYNDTEETWVREVSAPQQREPSSHEVFEAFNGVLTVEEDPKTGFVKISVMHQPPIVAERWVEWLIKDINEAVREQDVAEAKRSIRYLEEQVANTPLVDLQAIFFVI